MAFLFGLAFAILQIGSKGTFENSLRFQLRAGWEERIRPIGTVEFDFISSRQ